MEVVGLGIVRKGHWAPRRERKATKGGLQLLAVGTHCPSCKKESPITSSAISNTLGLGSSGAPFLGRRYLFSNTFFPWGGHSQPGKGHWDRWSKEEGMLRLWGGQRVP